MLSNIQSPRFPSTRNYIVLEKLFSGNHSEVYRCEKLPEHSKVIMKVTRGEHSTDKDVSALQHEYHLLKQLNFSGLVHAETLFREGQKWILILEDITGKSLDQYLHGQALELDKFFCIVLQLIDILDTLHQHHIIHKDIKPANIIIDPDTQRIKLIDLSISSQLSEETQDYINPRLLEGTLAYISPEQTGRMNLAIDYRSDFYSLGIMLFEMLTGQLPFQSSDILELIHAHIAKLPPDIREINPKVPSQIAALVAKLLAKNPENRYISAVGLKADLVNCMQQWQEKQDIDIFQLGQSDLHDHLHISHTLYGREIPIATLMARVSEVVTQGRRGLVLYPN